MPSRAGYRLESAIVAGAFGRAVPSPFGAYNVDSETGRILFSNFFRESCWRGRVLAVRRGGCSKSVAAASNARMLD